MDNPFLARTERQEAGNDQPVDDNPFRQQIAAGQQLAAAAGAINSVASSLDPGTVRTGRSVATHVVKKGCSIKIGSIWLPGCCGSESTRVPLRWHVLLLAIPVLTVLNALRLNFKDINHLFLQLANVPLLFVAVIVHEVGHLVAAKAHGGVPSHILLWPLGGLAVAHGPTMSLGARIRIALAGPLTHVPMTAVWMLLFAATGCSYSLGTIVYRPGEWAPACVAKAAMAKGVTPASLDLGERRWRALPISLASRDSHRQPAPCLARPCRLSPRCWRPRSLLRKLS